MWTSDLSFKLNYELKITNYELRMTNEINEQSGTGKGGGSERTDAQTMAERAVHRPAIGAVPAKETTKETAAAGGANNL